MEKRKKMEEPNLFRLSPYFNFGSLMWILLGCGLIKFHESYYNMKY